MSRNGIRLRSSLEWYDELLQLSIEPARDDPAGVLNRAVAVGHVVGVAAGIAETERVRSVLGTLQQWNAVRAYLFELDGDFAAAGDAYSAAADVAREVTERDHLIRRASRARARSAAERGRRLGSFGADGLR